MRLFASAKIITVQTTEHVRVITHGKHLWKKIFGANSKIIL